MKRNLRAATLFVFTACLLLASEVHARPACSAAIRGQFWPEAANSDGEAARRAARTGDLAICTREGWRYRWREVAVHWKSLVRTPETVAVRKTEKPGEVEHHQSGLR